MAETNRRRFYPATELRLERLRAGLMLADVAREANLPLTRASQLERKPEGSSAQDLEKYRAASRRCVGADA
jgi:hypothetical protein